MAVKALITGGTGFLGTAFARALRHRGHDVTVLSRRPRKPGEALWPPEGDAASLLALVDGTDAVINLAGESIAGGRWTPARKEAIRASRVSVTRALSTAISSATAPPLVFLSGSAVGFYGVRDSTPLDESSRAEPISWPTCAPSGKRPHGPPPRARASCCCGPGSSWTAGAARCRRWRARSGSGSAARSDRVRRYMSWVHIQDWVNLALWALERDTVSGPLNLTAPTPVTNAEFSRTLAGELRRPGFMRAPAFAMRLLLGEMADSLMLGGQRVLPRKAEAEGYPFRYAYLAPALHAVYGR